MTEPKEQTVGDLTFAKVDLEVWLWAIVSDYKGPQEFGKVVCAFHDEAMPDEAVVTLLLEALYIEYDRPRSGYNLEDFFSYSQ